MRAVVQRARDAKVEVDGKNVGNINYGLIVYVAITHDDSDKDIDYMVDKVVGLRIFEDHEGKMNLSVKDILGEILVISQFTLYGDVRKGKRPSFTESASYELGKEIYEKFIVKLRENNIPVKTGEYGADMLVEYKNEGPVTILLDSRKLF
ncbi:MAG: D-tyrosyl-tRNA(Tyr) deacylase [Tissierellales bacterium]|nr:D-tyrosyl-tRNA(Tyr) deacylase [Tissierellales bacterium]